MIGRFIVVEGADGMGKSTLVHALAERCRDAGRVAVETHEPGATVLGAELRRILLDSSEPISPRAEALLMAADRAQHIADVVAPSVSDGAIVISDRFLPSSLVYQGVARGLGVEEIEAINMFGSAGPVPDIVLVLDADDTVADERRDADENRFEREALAFHRQVRTAYRDLAHRYGWHLLDASGSPDHVAELAWKLVAPLVRDPAAP